jgi:hypothetical protein
MKKFITISILALSSLSAFANDSTVRLLAQDLSTTEDSSNSGVYTGLVAGISYADPKICTGEFSIGTVKSTLGDVLLARGKSSGMLDKKLTVNDEEYLIAVTLEAIYPCKQ